MEELFSVFLSLKYKSLLSIFFFFYPKEPFITCVPNTLLSAEEYLKIRFYPNMSQSSGAVRLKTHRRHRYRVHQDIEESGGRKGSTKGI